MDAYVLFRHDEDGTSAVRAEGFAARVDRVPRPADVSRSGPSTAPPPAVGAGRGCTPPARTPPRPAAPPRCRGTGAGPPRRTKITSPGPGVAGLVPAVNRARPAEDDVDLVLGVRAAGRRRRPPRGRRARPRGPGTRSELQPRPPAACWPSRASARVRTTIAVPYRGMTLRSRSTRSVPRPRSPSPSSPWCGCGPDAATTVDRPRRRRAPGAARPRRRGDRTPDARPPRRRRVAATGRTWARCGRDRAGRRRARRADLRDRRRATARAGCTSPSRPGGIRIVEDGAVLDDAVPRHHRTGSTSGGERGLLGLAFPPGFGAERPGVFVHYSGTNGETVVAAFRLDARRPGPCSTPRPSASCSPSRSRTPNHNGGWIGFDPDGMLLIAPGRRRLRRRPREPRLATWAAPRQDAAASTCCASTGGEPYAIPGDNPFVGRVRRTARDPPLRAAQPVPRQRRPGDRRPVDRRRGPGRVGGGRRRPGGREPASTSGGGAGRAATASTATPAASRRASRCP